MVTRCRRTVKERGRKPDPPDVCCAPALSLLHPRWRGGRVR
jgi:hypothetical protein